MAYWLARLIKTNKVSKPVPLISFVLLYCAVFFIEPALGAFTFDYCAALVGNISAIMLFNRVTMAQTVPEIFALQYKLILGFKAEAMETTIFKLHSTEPAIFRLLACCYASIIPIRIGV